MLRKFTSLLLAGTMIAVTSMAQTIKNSDISVEITSPANNTTVPFGDSLFLSFNYTNNGPDVLPAGDTLFFYIGGQVIYSYLLVDLGVNATMMMNNVVYFYNTTTEQSEGDICVIHIPQSSVIYSDSTVPTTTYIDSDTTNDVSCISVVMEGSTDTTTSIHNISNKNLQLNLYPNPTNGVINFDYTATLANQNLKAIISDVTGRIILSKDLKVQAPIIQQQYALDVSDIHPGIYFIEIQDGSNRSNGKFTISK